MGSLSRPYSIKRFKRLIDYLIYLLILLIERNNTPIPQIDLSMPPERRNVGPLTAQGKEPRQQLREVSTDRLEHLGLDVISTRSFTSRELTDIHVDC